MAKKINLEILPPYIQQHWGLSAVMNFTLGGAGAGLYLLGEFFTILGHSIPDDAQFISFQFLAPIILCCGFLSLSMEAGRPSRAHRLFRNLNGSWMCIESLMGGTFIVAALVNYFFAYFILKIIAVSAALIFMISQGFIVYRAAAIPAWNTWLIPIIFMTSGFLTACGFFLLNSNEFSVTDSLQQVFFLICISMNLVIWLFYHYRHFYNNNKIVIKSIRSPILWVSIVLVGHLVPFFVLFSLNISGGIGSGNIWFIFFSIASGIGLILGGLGQKAAIIFKAGYYRGINLEISRDKEKSECLF